MLSLPADKKAILYIKRIDNCIQMRDYLLSQGRSVEAIWSYQQTEKPMTKAQRAICGHIQNTGCLPEDLDILIINDAWYEGINITDPDVQYVVIQSMDSTKREQVLGRVRHDIECVYYLNKDIEDDKIIIIPKEYQGIDNMLNKERQKELIAALGLECGTTTAVRLYERSGYKITKVRGGFMITEE